jgi:glycosyltransferase involved in cell wall biosynthesis
MKILLINKFHYIKGGTETYFFGLKKMLLDHGHNVIEFSMKDRKNEISEYEKYFVSNVDYLTKQSFTQKIKSAWNLIYSKEAYKNMCNLIEDTKPDIAHVNLISHQLTPSVLHALKKYKIPVVFTSHDYKLVCPNYKLYNKNRTCEKCIKGNYLNCFIQKCHKNSWSYSFLLTIEAYYHKLIGSYNLIDKIICPSQFMYSQLIKSGFSRDKVVHIPNFLTNNFSFNHSNMESVRENSLLYFGRLSSEKGLDVLLDAKKKLNRKFVLKIIGEGPEKKRLEKRVQEEKIKDIEFMGFYSGDKLVSEIKKSLATIIPSVWHEVFGLTIIESFSCGTPVIGSDIGAISELIESGKTGYLYNSGDSVELASKINDLLDLSSEEYNNISFNCSNKVREFHPGSYYNKVLNIYESLVGEKLKKDLVL